MFHLSKLSLSCLYLFAFSINAQVQDDQASKNQNPLIGQYHFIFSSNALYGTNRDIDLNAFNTRNYIAPGLYNVNLSLNNTELADTTVKFEHSNGASTAVLCVDAALLSQLDLKAALLEKLPQQPCLSIKDIDSDANYDFNLQQLKLNIFIPLIDIEQRPVGYINPALFDYGVTSAFLAYNANIHKTSTRSSNYLNLNAGLNYAGWFYRHHGYFESTSTGQLNRYRSSLNTLYRDIDSLHARLSLGEFYSTNMSESLALLGVQLSSDDNMLPWSMRNYAPIISGVANSNALIRVSQNGQKIYEKSVAAGGFELTDLATLSNGDLRVEIIENNNEVRVLNFPMQVNIDLLKKGRMKYSLATGRFRLSNKITDHVIGQANLSYGLNNYITLSIALTYAEIYKNIMLNAAMNTAIGGLSFSAAESRSSLNKQSQVGQLYQVKYNYYYEAQQLQIHFNASNQSVSYQGANNALSIANYDQLNQEEYWSFWIKNNLKNQYGLSISKSFSDSGLGSIQGSIYRSEYWSDPLGYNQYMLSYSNRYKRLNYSLGFNRSKDRLNQQPYNIYYARISMPLDWKKNNLYLSSQLQHSDYAPHSTNANINLNGSLTQDNKINFGVGLSQNQFNQQQNTAINAHVNYLHPVINIGASLNHDRQQTQYSLSAQGAIVAHSLGLTATNTIPNTYTIVHVDQGQYAGISNAWGIRLDRFGNAIYSNSSPYNKNLIQIDPDQMPITSTLQSNQATVIPRLYSATMVNFSAQQSTIYVLRITSPHGQLPMGTEVRNVDQQLLGRLAQSNQVILNRYNPQSDHVLSLIWGAQRQNSCQIQLPVLNNKKQQSFQIISVECK